MTDYSTAPTRFVPRQRHSPVEAMEWTGKNWDAISKWVYGEVLDTPDYEYDGGKWPVIRDGTYLSVLEKDNEEEFAAIGDWLIKDGDDGWLVGDDTFLEEFVVDPLAMQKKAL